MANYTTEVAQGQKTWTRPVYRNVRLFVKLFIATFKYLMIFCSVTFIGLYSYYIFFVNNAIRDSISDAVSKAFLSATVVGSEAPGGRAQGCVIEGVPDCTGNAVPERELFRPIN